MPQLIVVATVMLAIAPAAVAAGIKARRWRFGGQIAIALLVAGVLVLVPEFFFADVTAWVSVVLMCVGVVVIAFGLAVIDQPEQFS